MEREMSSLWPVHEVVYTAIVGLVMVAALLEWFLWMAAFVYCLFKVYQKAEHWTVNVLAIAVGTAFVLIRCLFLPVMIVTLPLPAQITRLWPIEMVSFLQWFAFWSFAGLLTVPWLFCIYQLATHQLGRRRLIQHKQHHLFLPDETSAPKVVVVMPCYKEDANVLLAAVDSVVTCDYPAACIHVFLSFDGDQEDELFLSTISRLGVSSALDTFPPSIDIAYRGARVTISRFPHGGKRHCQKATFILIDRVYARYVRRHDDLFILFIDSDCILDRVCLQNFVYDMELSPGNRRDMLAMTGVITSTTQKHSLITLLQDMEYVHGQLFERTVESGCGAVTCLPGALTMLRFSAFRRMARYYFADRAESCADLFDFARSHLGEDRWLTHLFMIGAVKRHQIAICTSAFCKTEAVQTARALVKQRRRWFLGFITNEACMLTDWRLWRRYPLLVLVRFAQNTIRTTALLFLVMLLAITTTTKKVEHLPVGFIAVSLGLNWLLMIYFGAKLRRFKVWLYPLMFALNPFLNWYYMVYGIFTAGQRTWGGPRADAAAADEQTTAIQAIERAEATGDDLNVVPETFIPAAEARRRNSAKGKKADDGIEDSEGAGERGLTRSRSVTRPPDLVVGRFAAPERNKAGMLFVDIREDELDDSSLVSLGTAAPVPSAGEYPKDHGHLRGGIDSRLALRDLSEGQKPNYNVPRHPLDNAPAIPQLGERGSLIDNVGPTSLSAQDGAAYRPRRVQSLMGEEDRRKYELAHQSYSGGGGPAGSFWDGTLHTYIHPGPSLGPLREAEDAEQRTDDSEPQNGRDYAGSEDGESSSYATAGEERCDSQGSF